MMKRAFAITAVALALTLAAAAGLFAGEQQKVVAIGDVDAGYSMSGQKAYDVKETIQLGLKKELEKLGKGSYSVNIVSPAVVTEGSEPEAVELPELPQDRAPTQKEMAKYMAAMQRFQKQMTGEVKVHKPVSADYFFEFRVESSSGGADTGGMASTIGGIAGVDTSLGDVSTKKERVNLVATMRDPRTGSLMDKHVSKATSVKFRNLGGYTSYDYGDDSVSREKLFSSAIRDCAKWMNGKIEGD
jgi:hypothetical protein